MVYIGYVRREGVKGQSLQHGDVTSSRYGSQASLDI